MKGGIFIAGLGTLIVLIIFMTLAPLYNQIVSSVMANSNDDFAKLLVQLVFPCLILSLIFGILYSVNESNQQTSGNFFG